MTAIYIARKIFKKISNQMRANKILPLVEQNQTQQHQKFNIQAYNPEAISLKACLSFALLGLFLLFTLLVIVPQIEHKNAILPLIGPFCHSVIFPIATFCFNGKFRKFVCEMCT